ncbi:MAG: response regulator [Acidobacteria bacterium]|nr:response regulator [Acidobacteriota bacterium]
MKVLVADDDPVSRRMLEAMLGKWGYDLRVVEDGLAAWQAVSAEGAPRLIILDWMMPGMDGVEVCRKIRESPATRAAYVVLLTARGSQRDIVLGLEAGADDFITKPFNREELRARLSVGERVLHLQGILADRVRDLEDALGRVKQLQGLLPICSYCKKIRDDNDYWQKVEDYLGEHSDVTFSHGICPECYEKRVKPELGKLGAGRPIDP